VILLTGMVKNSSAAGNGVNIKLRYGTGTAPVYGQTSGLGSQAGSTVHFIAATTAAQSGFSILTVVNGLNLNVTYWFDITLTAVGAGGASVTDLQFISLEV
jgi:hypothetical protein